MKHYIISKFRPGTPWREYLPEIEAIFARTLTIEGVHGVDIFPSCSKRPNRFDLMICMDMDAAALPLYDASEPHRAGKVKKKKKEAEDMEQELLQEIASYWGTRAEGYSEFGILRRVLLKGIKSSHLDPKGF